MINIHTVSLELTVLVNIGLNREARFLMCYLLKAIRSLNAKKLLNYILSQFHS